MAKNDDVDIERGERIQYLRKEVLKLRSQAALASMMATKVSRGAVGNWELGQKIGLTNLRELAALGNTTIEWITDNVGDPPSRDGVLGFERRGGEMQVSGYVGAGQAIESLDELGDWVDRPSGAHPDTVAVYVRGDSMYPAYSDGEVLYYSRQMPPKDVVNRRCVVRLADGRMFVKILRPGSNAKFWTLSSVNSLYPDMIDQVVDWAAPIDWVKPR